MAGWTRGRHAARMHSELQRLIDEGNGVVDRLGALGVAPTHLVEGALRRRWLHRVAPRTYLSADLMSDELAVLRAAVRYGAPSAALSHVSALRLWQLPTPPVTWVHLMTSHGRHLRGAPGIRVHRREEFVLEPPAVVIRDDLPVTRLETAIVDSWPVLDGDAKSAPAIAAVGQRMTTASRIMEALEDFPRLGGRRLLVRLLRLLERGCRSPLELWGYDNVLRGGRLNRLRWQVPQRVGGHAVYMDALDEESGVNIELDGATWHSSWADRERDLRRDAALMAQGFVVARFSSARLRREPDVVRNEILSIIDARLERRRSS
jgi:very-short-patch-repair endonuclease